ncbi:MAG: LysR family transcriptional regulator substrate-binding protein, partial [Clostridium sp.]|nr:LysR family transcriptional regulator substrate-binding protein [Clostridium sp.]
ASHPFVKQFPSGSLTSKELALLEHETFIITRKSGKFARVCLDICGLYFPPVNLIEINSLDTLYALIAKNTGVGFIPATFDRSEQLGKKIVCYHLENLQAQQTFVIARDPARTPTAAAQEFIGMACGLFHERG